MYVLFRKKIASFLQALFCKQKKFFPIFAGQTKNDSSGATAINPLFRNAMWTIAYGSEDPEFVKRKFT